MHENNGKYTNDTCIYINPWGSMGGWCAWVYAEVVGCVVQRVAEQSNCSKLVRGLYVSVAEHSTVEVGEELWW